MLLMVPVNLLISVWLYISAIIAGRKTLTAWVRYETGTMSFFNILDIPGERRDVDSFFYDDR
jgi:hypothetical protein